MSVNITLNGNYTNRYQKHNLLNDPERVKQNEENERRKIRIQQVRAVSKNVAKKLRNDVELEKERQLRKIEEIKMQEMEMWRKNLLAQQESDFKSAIFQVGTAHRAAQAENARAQKLTQQNKKKTLSQPKKTISSKDGKENLKANVRTFLPSKSYSKPPALLDYEDVVSKAPKPMNPNSSAVYSSEFEADILEESSSYRELTQASCQTFESSSTTFSDSDKISKSEQCKRTFFTSKQRKTDKVLNEMQVDNGASPVNRLEIEDEEKQILMSKKTNKQQKSETKVTDETHNIASTSAVPKKRFTRITDIIRQQSSNDTHEAKEITDHSGPINSRASIVPQVCEESHERTSPTKSKSLLRTSFGFSDLEKSPSKFKKLSNISRPLSTVTTSSSFIPSARSAPGRVQFYDYNNKFHKEYDQPAAVVEKEKQSSDRMTAMEQADLANELRKVRESEMESLRQKSAERCQKAIEREQVRHACQALTAKLDALTKQGQVLPSDNHQFSSARYGQVAAEKETKRSSAVENILRRPAVITCPEINPMISSSNNAKSYSYDLNLGSALTCNDINSFTSSDSCCSILLGFVNDQSKEVADDIKKIDKKTGETDKDKACKLKDLLIRINRLRDSLINELEKCTNLIAPDSERVQKMLNSITAFRTERENIFIDGSSTGSISKRENDLKKKEALFEKKLREFYELQKVAKKTDNSPSMQGDLKDTIVAWKEKVCAKKTEKAPIKSKQGEIECSHKGKAVGKESADIQTKLSGHKNTKTKSIKTFKTETEKYPCNDNEREPVPRERNETLKKKSNVKEPEIEDQLQSSQEESDVEVVEQRSILTESNPIEIVIKVKGQIETKKARKPYTKSPRRLSTLIQNSTKRKKFKILPTMRSNESASTSYRSLPSKIRNNLDEGLRNIDNPKKQSLIPDSQRQFQGKEQINSLKKHSSNLNPLMAHYVQRLLGMSRTSIDALAVNSSDIDTPSSSIMNTTANISATNNEKFVTNRLKNVQKFIEDNYSFIGELEESLRQSNSTDSSLKTIEIAWKNALKDQERRQMESYLAKTGNEKLKKSVIKNTPKPPLNAEKRQASSVDKSTQLTHNCTQRIAELTEMINQVRKEKQKIIETTLSSGSENERHSTEYLDLPNNSNNSEKSGSRNLESQLLKSTERLSTQSPDNTVQLEKNKSTGMSRDSGISLSRPITVQENRDSPVDDSHQGPSPTETLSAHLKKPKPPISIARYSPQLVEDIPHELSTIFEVDTPATSRINVSINAKANCQQLDACQFQDEQAKQITYRKFPTFEEYTRLHQLDMSRLDPEFSTQFEREFNEFISLAKEGKIKDYEEFTSFSKYLSKSSSGRDDRESAEELLTSLKIANLSFKKFPTRKEYLHKIGISTSDLLDSMNVNNTDDSKNINSNSSSTESLMNIEKELKIRKILTKPFQQNATLDYRSDMVSDNCPHEGDISGIRQLTSGVSSSDDQSYNLESDLNHIGIKWPSAMKKKTMETQALSSTNSSSVAKPVLTPKRRQMKGHSVAKSSLKETYATCETTSQDEDCGRRLDLREFIAKELLKCTTTSSSFSYSDDSIAGSILRSIIGSMASSPHQKVNGAGPSLDRHKTSTPMASHSTSSEKPASGSQGAITSAHLFSGESRLSSVHFNNSSRDTNQVSEQNVGT